MPPSNDCAVAAAIPPVALVPGTLIVVPGIIPKAEGEVSRE